MIPLLGFAPDADPTTAGIITDCTNFIPYLNGMQGAPSALTPSGTPALASECLGASVVTALSGTRRIYAGTTTKLYELSGGSWIDRSSAVYTGGADTRWMFAQFGDATIATNKADAMQRSTGGAFSAIAGAPKAEIVYNVGAFVMALNVNDGTEKTDGWACCAAYNDLDWATSTVTQATSGRLVSSPGQLTAGLRLGEYAVAYKSKAIFLGQYVGAPLVWDWIPVPGGEAGCVGKEALCDIGGVHFFVGEDNFWLFDGTRPTPIGDNAVRQWFFDNSNPAARYRTKCVFDRQNNRVWVFYPSNSSTSCDQALVYHVLSKKWGRVTTNVQAVLNYIATGVTYDTLSSTGSTYDTLPAVSYDSQYWLAGGQALSAFNSSNQLQLLTGPSASSGFTTGDVGDDDTVTLLRKIRMRFAQAPTTANVQTFYKMNLGDSYAAGASGAINGSKFDVLRSARWHRGQFSFTGDVKVMAADVDLKPAAMR